MKGIRFPASFWAQFGKQDVGTARKARNLLENGNFRELKVFLKEQLKASDNQRIMQEIDRLELFFQRISVLTREVQETTSAKPVKTVKVAGEKQTGKTEKVYLYSKENIQQLDMTFIEVDKLFADIGEANAYKSLKPILVKIFLAYKGLALKTKWHNVLLRQKYKAQLKSAIAELSEFCAKMPQIGLVLSQTLEQVGERVGAATLAPIVSAILILLAGLAFGLPLVPGLFREPDNYTLIGQLDLWARENFATIVVFIIIFVVIGILAASIGGFVGALVLLFGIVSFAGVFYPRIWGGGPGHMF